VKQARQLPLGRRHPPQKRIFSKVAFLESAIFPESF